MCILLNHKYVILGKTLFKNVVILCMYSGDRNLGYILISEVEGFAYILFSFFGLNYFTYEHWHGIWNGNILNDHKVVSCCLYR